jgi:hypothetical protein
MHNNHCKWRPTRNPRPCSQLEWLAYHGFGHDVPADNHPRTEDGFWQPVVSASLGHCCFPRGVSYDLGDRRHRPPARRRFFGRNSRTGQPVGDRRQLSRSRGVANDAAETPFCSRVQSDRAAGSPRMASSSRLPTLRGGSWDPLPRQLRIYDDGGYVQPMATGDDGCHNAPVALRALSGTATSSRRSSNLGLVGRWSFDLVSKRSVPLCKPPNSV